MKCQNCGENEANVKYTQMINGDKEEMFLCEKCAKKLKLDMNFKFGFDDIFSSLFGEGPLLRPIEISDGLVCDACGTKYDDFASNGMVGCENCYKVFSNRLDKVLKRLHGNNRHVEDEEKPRPTTSKTKNKNNDIKSEIAKLKEKLESCIKSEDYEQAAILRDKIRKLESKIKEKNIERGE